MNKILQLLLTAAIIHLIIFVTAQSPQAMNYQAIARNTSGAVLQNQYINVRFSIRDGSPNAPIVYEETDTATTNQFGLFTVAIGTGQVQVGTSLTAINWATGNKYLQVGFDDTGGINFINMGVSELLSVPYAMYANNAVSVTGPTHYLGQLYGGGVIFHLYTDSIGQQHGLIVALNDQRTSAAWSNIQSTAVGAGAKSFWNGPGNTTAIIAQAGQDSSAALFCKNYNGGGYNDWYLPSIGELQLLFNNSFNVNKTLSTAGTQIDLYYNGNNGYWSSTEIDASDAWFFLGGPGIYLPNSNKAQPSYVRAVRAF